MNMSNGDETFIGAIDQGTSSTRFLIFNAATQEVVASHQVILIPVTLFQIHFPVGGDSLRPARGMVRRMSR